MQCYKITLGTCTVAFQQIKMAKSVLCSQCNPARVDLTEAMGNSVFTVAKENQTCLYRKGNPCCFVCLLVIGRVEKKDDQVEHFVMLLPVINFVSHFVFQSP